MQRGPAARATAALDQKAVGGDQQHLEEHEQIEQVGGQKGAGETEQLQLEQGVEMTPAALGGTGAQIGAQTGVQTGAQSEMREHGHPQSAGERQHQGREPVGGQHDAIGDGPVPDQGGGDVALCAQSQQRNRRAELTEGADQAEPVLLTWRQRRLGEEPGAKTERQREGDDQQQTHRAPSSR